jgi:hypothetical protein
MELSPSIAARIPEVVDCLVAELKTIGIDVRRKAA